MNNALVDTHFVTILNARLAWFMESQVQFESAFARERALVSQASLERLYRAFTATGKPGKRGDIAVFHEAERGVQSVPYVSVGLGPDELKDSFLGDAIGEECPETGARVFHLDIEQDVVLTCAAHTDEMVRALYALVFAALVFEKVNLIRAGYDDVSYKGKGSISSQRRLVAEQGGVLLVAQRWRVALMVNLVETPTIGGTAKPWFLHPVGLPTSPAPEPNQHPPVDSTKPNPTPSRQHDDAGDNGGVTPYK